ncbi:pyridoxamine 5'-phosphate oxidase family protein [soil metagenome]
MLRWPDAEAILRGGRYLWLATSDADGSPHLVQQWGVWIDSELWFEGSDRTRWARNLARRPQLAFGTQVGDRAVYGRAVVEIVRNVERTVAVRIAREYTRKYGRVFSYRPKPEQYETGHAFRAKPEKVIAFDVKHFNTSAARFTFA